jgi:hypothetical protein
LRAQTERSLCLTLSYACSADGSTRVVHVSSTSGLLQNVPEPYRQWIADATTLQQLVDLPFLPSDGNFDNGEPVSLHPRRRGRVDVAACRR